MRSASQDGAYRNRSGSGATPNAATFAQASLHFLQGGGEMGARMRAFDWTATPLGPPNAWPQSLKTIVRVMLDSRYAMWMLWGPDKTFFCNDAYLPTVGIKRDWVLGARSDKVWEEIWPDIGPRIEHVLTHGEATWDEGLLLFLERSGFTEETYHTFSYSPVYDDDTHVAGMLCVVTEVTERVIGERRLRVLRDLAARTVGVETVEASCRRACQVLAQYPLDVPFAALHLSQQGARNDGFIACTHVSVPAALEAPLQEALDALYVHQEVQHVRDLPAIEPDAALPTWREPVRRILALALSAAGQSLAGALVVGCSTRRPLDDDYRAFLDLVAGQVAAAIADAQAYEAERRRAEALAELDRAKTVFFSNVSHEFRTPLTLLLGPIEDVIADASVPDRARHLLEVARRNAARLQRLVNSLLDFSRIEAARTQVTYERTDLALFTRDLASSFRSAMERAGLVFDVDCTPLTADVYVDRQIWEKIVLNLLSNAFKFTFDGGVTLRLRQVGREALLEVSDTGVGIPAAELPRVFERFHRVEGTVGRTHEGSGIGLALVHEIVKLHGGHIDASSTPGQGSSFRVHIPLGTDHLPKDRIKAPRELAQGGGAAQSFVDEALRWLPDGGEADSMAASVSMAPLPLPASDRRFASTFGSRIVLADDNADMRGYISGLLAPYYVVQSVGDGEQALAAARQARPDLILSDVMMPRLDGFGLLAAVRADESLRSVPVVLLSARAGEESRILGMDSGADDYIVKPFSARELLARLGALLELRRMHRAAEEASRLRTAQFETLLNEAPLGVYVVDADFRVREANPTAWVTFGQMPDLIGRNFADAIRQLWPADFADAIIRLFRHTLETGEAYFSPEHSERRRDRGSIERYEWQINRIPLLDGRFGVVCYFREISAYIRARERLEAADRQKDEFLAMLAHELRNPLAPIRNAGEILARVVAENAPAQNAVGIVQRQVATLTRLVDDLLDVSRISQGRVELQRAPIRLADVVALAVETVEPLVKERNHQLAIAIYRPMVVNGDQPRLVQCVANLLTNAAKYTEDGGHIQLEVRSNGDEAVLTVTDTGMGISADLLPSVFDLFVQGDRTLDRAQGGLGIGLSVVKRLVEMHGGSVRATSDGDGKGSRFEMRLPVIERSALDEQRAQLPSAPRQRILVVDDNADAADSLAMVLALDGHQVECAYSAQQAIDRAPAYQPDLALLDIGLPGMDGYELARRLRRDPALAHLRLVALTGYGQAEDKLRARMAGFDSHLVKPAERTELQAVLAQGARHADA